MTIRVKMDKHFKAALEEDYSVEDMEDLLRSSKIFREVMRKALTNAIDCGIIGGDNIETFKGENPLAVLAHKAGFREGLRYATKLLRPEVEQ